MHLIFKARAIRAYWKTQSTVVFAIALDILQIIKSEKVKAGIKVQIWGENLLI